MASKRRQRRKACDGKLKHATREAAAWAARRVRHLGWLEPYGCRFCGAWHIGHPPASVRQSLIDKARHRRQVAQMTPEEAEAERQRRKAQSAADHAKNG